MLEGDNVHRHALMREKTPDRVRPVGRFLCAGFFISLCAKFGPSFRASTYGVPFFPHVVLFPGPEGTPVDARQLL
jgi:hypothetical protein